MLLSFFSPPDHQTHTLEIPTLPAIELIYVQGGKFEMGGESGYDDSKPIHPVALSDFWIGKYPVTQALWEAVMGENPSRCQSPTRPVEQVSWEDCQAFITKLNSLVPTSGLFSLPTEAQWEYAARGGKYDAGYVYAGSNDINEVAWYDDNSHDETKPVGLQFPNQLGIYDMTGNVWEWCADDYDSDFYQKCAKQGIVTNPLNKDSEAGSKLIRGGSYFSNSETCALSLPQR
jgi:formylglycine-generating enzyme